MMYLAGELWFFAWGPIVSRQFHVAKEANAFFEEALMHQKQLDYKINLMVLRGIGPINNNLLMSSDMNDKWNMTCASKSKGTSSEQKKTADDAPRKNCWEVMKCGREPGGARSAELCVCPAAVFTALPDGEYNNGDFLGRRCWRISGTLCEDQIQGTFARKIDDCRLCEFYKLVKEQEGDDFVE